MSLDLSRVDLDRLPTHIGLILDGNGRWANARGLTRTEGHLAGEEALFDVVQGAVELGIQWMTAFTFSTENWARSAAEVEFLMWFNEDLLLRRRDDLHAKGVRMHFVGDVDDQRIPERNRAHMRDAIELTRGNRKMNMVFAFNYGSRQEIARAARQLASAATLGDIDVSDIDEDAVASALHLPDMPDVDLVIRTSGEQRLSNFLLWQAAYAELIFPETLWPDFDRHSLVDAVVEYQSRHRRFGSAEDSPADQVD
ncbi:MAG: polyprenyl diphosphate synthase [Acidimicrobiia bacterium]|nr:polyprenyl diphosphate synthase [Acidimicrobiia bacterium]